MNTMGNLHRLLAVSEATARELVRRRGVLVLLVLFPLPFYLSRHNEHTGQSIRFLFLGLAWAVSAAALFVGHGGRVLEQRLSVSGYRAAQVWVGRMLALWALGVLVAAPYLVLVAVDQPGVRIGAIAAAMALCVAAAAPFGLLLGLLVPRELEGALLLLVAAGMQMMIDPASPAARLLPFWSGREIGTYAIDHTDSGFLMRGAAHGVATTLLLATAVAVASARRLRRRPHMRPLSSA
ncbi:MAG TPA: ABC transporter permease [Yinghuangia sp.]|uniref:ABC transporter permease n=1 Tax=Yinghuangia sp. YIM S10712 TaxID=3436930 RepID=UPI002CB58DEF|nr:ABC transporter permease [Yinghuangia sp.]